MTKFEGENGQVKKVYLSNGEILDADMVLLGTGMAPNTEYVGNLKKA